MNDRDCENCIHKVNGACNVWECKFEPKRGMTPDEAILILKRDNPNNIAVRTGYEDLYDRRNEAFSMAIKALKQIPSISEDGTLTVNVEDGSKVSRVLVCGDNHFGGLYYPDQEPCDKCVYSTNEGCQYDDITETIPPFDDCISRQAVLDAINTDWHEDLSQLEDAIKALPPVVPKQRTGHWVFVDEAKEHARCSECNCGNVDLFDGKLHNYCEVCGAKMVESEVNDAGSD